MKTALTLFVLSAVAITTTNQAAVPRKSHVLEVNDFGRHPWPPRRGSAGAEAWSVAPEDVDNASRWNVRGTAAARGRVDSYEEEHDVDWRYPNEHGPAGLRAHFLKGSSVMPFGTRDGKLEVRDHENIDRTPWMEAFEDHDGMLTRNRETKNRNVGNDKMDSIDGKQAPEKLGSISVNPVDESDEMYSLESGQSATKPTQVGKREDSWPYKHDAVQINNDYWYTDDEHPGYAFMLPGVSIMGRYVPRLDGEWKQNTATGEMGEPTPWEEDGYEQSKATGPKTGKQ